MPAAKVAILNLLQLYAFSYLIGNGDLHAKNISLICKSNNHIPELSPAYDLICTYIYGDQKMAVKLDGRDDNLKRRNFIEFGERFSIPASATASMLDKMLRKFSMSLEILESITMTAKKRALVNKVIAKRRKDLL